VQNQNQHFGLNRRGFLTSSGLMVILSAGYTVDTATAVPSGGYGAVYGIFSSNGIE